MIAALTLFAFVVSCASQNRAVTLSFMPKVNDAEMKSQKPGSILVVQVNSGHPTYRNFLASHMTSMLDGAGFYAFPYLLSQSALKDRVELGTELFNKRFPISGEFQIPLRATSIEQYARRLGADSVLYIEVRDGLMASRNQLEIRLILTSSENGRMLWNHHKLVMLKSSGGGIGNIGSVGPEGAIALAILAYYILMVYIVYKAGELVKNKMTGYNNRLYKLQNGLQSQIEKSGLIIHDTSGKMSERRKP